MKPISMLDDAGTMPTRSSSMRRNLGTYDSYADAERAVDRLSDAGFPGTR